MKEYIREILDKLYEGKIDAAKAEKLIRKHDVNKVNLRKKARKLKIRVLTSDGKKINIPAIPFSIISGLGNISMKVASIFAKKGKHIDEEHIKYLKILDDINLKEILNELKHHEPYYLVEVYDGEDGDTVEIMVK